MYDRAWLDSLKAGDSVYVSGGYGSAGYIKTVARTTATQIILEHTNSVGSKYESRYRRKDGFTVGDSNSYHRGLIQKVIPELIERVHRAALLKAVASVKFGTQSTEKLQRLVAIIQE